MYRVTFAFTNTGSTGREENGSLPKVEIVSALAEVIGLHTESQQQHALYGRLNDLDQASLLRIKNALSRGHLVTVLVGRRYRLTALNSSGAFEAVKDQSLM
jgi:hypothetical protein